jgi:hypothetical protein
MKICALYFLRLFHLNLPSFVTSSRRVSTVCVCECVCVCVCVYVCVWKKQAPDTKRYRKHTAETAVYSLK